MNSRYKKALNLRLKGKSYGEIKKTLGVPKSTLSGWFKDLELPASAQEILKEKDRKGRTHLVEYNKRRTRRIQIKNYKTLESHKKQIQALSKYELKLVGSVLYWAEGHNKDVTGKGHEVCFTNSDSDMIKLYLRFLREIICVPEDKLRADIHIYPSINKEKALRFWVGATNIPREQFRITQCISRASKRKRPLNSLPYGTLKLSVGKRQNFFRIKGWIKGIIIENS